MGKLTLEITMSLSDTASPTEQAGGGDRTHGILFTREVLYH